MPESIAPLFVSKQFLLDALPHFTRGWHIWLHHCLETVISLVNGAPDPLKWVLTTVVDGAPQVIIKLDPRRGLQQNIGMRFGDANVFHSLQ